MSPPGPDDPRRCTAKSKQRQDRCKAWATPGEHLCRHHGGPGARACRGKPNLGPLKHGEKSGFVPRNPEAVRLRRKLATTEGRVDLLAENVSDRRSWAAVLEPDPETKLKLHDADRSDVLAMTRIEEAKEQADVQQTLVIQAPNLTQPTYTPVRGPHGMADLISLPDGKHLLSCEPGVWREAKRTVTEEGAEVWQPVLELGAGQ